MAKGKMNGSTELLAKAMRSVFTEAVEGGVEPLRKDVKRLEEGLETTNKNIQAQLAQNRKDISSDVRRILKRG